MNLTSHGRATWNVLVRKRPGISRTILGAIASWYSQPRRFGALMGLSFAFIYYYWTAHPPLDNLIEAQKVQAPPRADRYNAQARAFLAGQTHLLEQPRPELLALDDPYDPIQSHQQDAKGLYCLHDASLYKGKYYSYFGVVPAATLFAPYILITGHGLPVPLAATFYACGGLLFTVLLLNFFAASHFPALRNKSFFVLVLAVTCCNCVPYLLRSPAFYEIAIISAYCFSMGGLYFLAHGCLGGKFRPISMAWGSLFLGLAIGCRPHMALVGMIALGAIGFWQFLEVRREALDRMAFLRRMTIVAAPWLSCVAMLAAYNYQRFDSPFEFGARYALVGGGPRIKDMQLLSLQRIPGDLDYYLFHPARFKSQFPYVSIDPPLVKAADLNMYLGFDSVGGILICMPFLCFLILSPVTLYRTWKNSQFGLFSALCVLLGSGVALLVFVSSFSVAMRYVVDFNTLLMMGALLVFLDLNRASLKWPTLKWLLRMTAVVLLAVSCFFNLGIGMVGQRSVPQDMVLCNQLGKAFPEIPFFNWINSKLRPAK